MGNVLTFYQTNKTGWVKTDFDLCSFTIVNSNITLSDINIYGNWEVVQSNGLNGKYNLTFKYKINNVYTCKTFDITYKTFQVKTSKTLDLNIGIEWSNDLTDLTYPYNKIINTDCVMYGNGSGGGDPHIIPLFNNDIYILNSDNQVYKYFDNLCKNERVVCNVKMWVLSYFYIAKMLQLKKNNMPFQHLNSNINNHINDLKINPLDTSFAKYISIIYQTENNNEVVIIDTETLDIVEYNNDLINNYKLNKQTNVNLTNIKVSEIEINTEPLFYLNKLKFDSRTSLKRTISVNTKKHGLIQFRILLEKDKPNHRNHIEIMFDEMNLVNNTNCCGTLIDINQSEIVKSLNHINDNLTIYDKYKCSTLTEYKIWRKQKYRKMYYNNELPKSFILK